MIETKLRKSAFDSVEKYLENYQSIKNELHELKELQTMSENGVLPLEAKGYAATSGITIYKQPLNDEEIVFLSKYMEHPSEMADEFGVPCRNHVVNAEFCGAFYIHMSKCRQSDCPLFDCGMPTESHKFQRISENWMYLHSDIEKEINEHLEVGEIPHPSLLKIAYYSAILDNPKTIRQRKRKEIGRKPMPASLRFDVLNRDDFKCVYCGRTPSEDDVKLHVDHVLPYSKGGKDTMENLVTACVDCNLGKSDKTITKG